MTKQQKQSLDQTSKATMSTVLGSMFLVIGCATLATSTHSTANKIVSIVMIAVAAVMFGISIGIQRKK